MNKNHQEEIHTLFHPTFGNHPQPLVSIIVPVYNTAEYVEECIQSILVQTYKNIELVLVNDGSTDGSGEICKKYELLPNVKYYSQDNHGVTSARRKGVVECTGEWITFMDSDDYYMRDDAILMLVSDSEGVDIVFGSAGKGYSGRSDLPSFLSYEKFLEMQYGRELSAGPWAKLYNRRLFTENTLNESKNIKRAQDYLMNLELAVENRRPVKLFKKSVYYLREHPKSRRHTFILNLDYMLSLTKMADRIVEGHLPQKIVEKAKAKQRRYFFYETISTNGFRSSANHPYAIETKKLLKQTSQLTLMDRWLLSVSSPWAVKMVWNLKKVARRLEHPSIIICDLKRLAKIFA
ncbi:MULTISPECIES: glycosyltransferase family 2 protein [unclassified Prevotella]|uniref:glycosyltransferase family 2 protein n=1 Tax=unclassified Prevotella TaxID=2638335 RepID=UPI0006856782|nr:MULTISPECIES: glycosyltransferase family 2 protein [unclassified Prevotella]